MDERGQKQPMCNVTFRDAAAEWKKGFLEWESGVRPDYCGEESRNLEYWEWEGPPPGPREAYRPWRDEEATWWQVWETVSDGTPVTPPFPLVEKLIDYLVIYGDEWDQRAGRGGWSRANAEAFCRDGWAPSIVVVNGRVFDGAREMGDWQT
jgi:hypothetical protein